MHRHLYEIYTEEDTPRIDKETRRFRSLLNANAISVEKNENVLFNDIIAEYVVDTKQYTRNDYNPTRAKELFVSPVSDKMQAYLKERVEPSFQEMKQNAKEQFELSLQEYKELYQNDSDYPIYVRSLGAKEKYEKSIKTLSQGCESIEWILKEKSLYDK